MSTTQNFTIFGRLPGMNEIIKASKSHFAAFAKMKARETKRCSEAAICGMVKKVDGPVDILVRWIEPNKKRDLDNIHAGIKFILDGLVLTGRIKNDTREHINSLSHEFPSPDAKNPRVEVYIHGKV